MNEITDTPVDWIDYEIVSGIFVKLDKLFLSKIQVLKWRSSLNRQGQLLIQTRMKVGDRLQTMQLTRVLLEPPDGLVACLKNPDCFLDYRSSNLIMCTHQERAARRRKSKRDLTSSLKGVSFNKQTQKWRSSICHEGRTYYLGEYEAEADAATAYAKAVRSFFGESVL